jgi:indole-3-glycerol phosphate synthase
VNYTFLEEMAVASQVRVEYAKEKQVLADLADQVSTMPPAKALDFPGQHFVIVELLRKAPHLPDGQVADLEERLARSHRAGVNAIAIHTEPSRFGGSLSDLVNARFSTQVPLIRSDFLVDPYQVYESRAAGADGIIVRVPIIDDKKLKAIIETTHKLGMFAIIDAWGENDILRAVAAGAEIISVTARSPDDHSLHPIRLKELRPFIPKSAIAIAQGGLHTVEEVKSALDLGYQGVLMASALLEHDNPEEFIASIVATAEDSESEDSN